MLRSIPFVAFLVFSTLSCGDDKKSDKVDSTKRKSGEMSGLKFLYDANQEIKVSSNGVQGSGDIFFVNPVGEAASAASFSLTFQIEDGKKIEFSFYNSGLVRNGLRYLFSRSGKKLTLSVSRGDGSSSTIDFDGIDASQEIAVVVDVHNNETPAHSLMWLASEAAPNELNSLYNSDADGGPSGSGTGGYWSAHLSGGGILKKASVGKPSFGH